MTKREELIATWNSFKQKLLKLVDENQKLTCFQQHKKLLQEAVEFRLNGATEFISSAPYSQRPTGLGMPADYQLTSLVKPAPGNLEAGREYVKKQRWNAYLAGGIVEECREFLEKLNQI